LVFATLVANSTVAGSARAVLHEIVGPATLQLRSRGDDGFDESLLSRVERQPGVREAAPVLEQSARLRGPRGAQATVSVVGAGVSLATLDGLAHTLPISTLDRSSIALTRETAQQTGVGFSSTPAAGTPVSVDLRGRAIPLKIGAVLGPEAIGAISQTLVAVMPLEELQRISGLNHRISRILVRTEPGRAPSVRRELEMISRGRITVAGADHDLVALRQVLRPSAQASAFFAVIATLLGFLFAFNAMLLTAPARRQAIADFRLGGARRSVIVEMVLSQAVCLGLAASVAGGLVGYALVRTTLHPRPGYLAQAFTLGGGTVIGLEPLGLAVLGGIIAVGLASAIPLLDLRSWRVLDAAHLDEGEPGQYLSAATTQRLALGAGALLMLSTACFVVAHSLALVATALLAIATVLAVPLIFTSVLRVAEGVANRYERFTSLSVALRSLRATRLRSLALVATGAVALFGAVALGGARTDLLAGLHHGAAANAADGDVLVINPSDTEQTTSFRADDLASRIARVKGVAHVRAFQSSFDEVGSRRVLILARPSGTGRQILKTQMIQGNSARALSRLSGSGWVAVSQQLADELHARLGGPIMLPTPAGGARLRVAAITTNLGWPGGAIFMNTTDYSRLWETSASSALVVQLQPGASSEVSRREIARALGAMSGLEVVTAAAWIERYDQLAGAGLSQLAEISTLLVIAAALAMTAALISSIWQRRLSLAGLRLSGVRPARLRRILLVEMALVLCTGCLTGVVAGTYGQVIVDGYLKQVTGFPVWALGSAWRPVEVFIIVMATVLALGAAPGWSASRVSPALALAQE
jgi:putative ABC transport system permease protein